MMARGEPLFRQWELLKTLQAHRFGISTGELAERLGCCKRTVQRDLTVLQVVFPIESERREFGKRFWRLPSRFIESRELQLTVTETLSLCLSQRLLAPLAGTPFGDGLATAIEKIKALLPTRALGYFRDLDEAFLIKSVGQEDYSGKSGEIAILNDAILNERVVRVTYHSASQGRDLTSDFHPYGIVLLAASLYCTGYLAEYDEVRTLKVSRLRRVQRTRATFEKPATFSLAKHTHGAFGVFGPGKVQTVRARFTGWAATNVREHRWHRSEKVVRDDGKSVTAEFELTRTAAPCPRMGPHCFARGRFHATCVRRRSDCATQCGPVRTSAARDSAPLSAPPQRSGPPSLADSASPSPSGCCRSTHQRRARGPPYCFALNPGG